MKSKRSTGLVIFVLLLLGAGVYLLVRYLSYIEEKDPLKMLTLPELRATIIEIKNISRQKTEMNVKMLVANPLPFKVGADSIAYEFFISDSSVLKTTHRQSVSLNASDTSWILIPITLDNQKLVSVLERADKNGFDSVYYEVRGSFYSNLLNDKKFNFHYGKRLPLVHIPKVEIGRVEIDSANFNRFKLLIHATVKNENVFPFDSKDISYRFAVAGNPWIKGFKPGLTDIPADTTVELVFPVTVSLEEVGETVFTFLRKGRNIGYAFEADLRIVADNKMLANSLVIITSDGMIREVIDLAKKPKKSAKNNRSRKE